MIMKFLPKIPAPLLYAVPCLVALAASAWSQGSGPDNPPVDSGYCDRYNWANVDLTAGGNKVLGSTSEPSDCTKVSPDSENRISLSINLPANNGGDCASTALVSRIRDAKGKEADMPASISTCEWASPVVITIVCTREGQSQRSVCRTYKICFSPCERSHGGCSTCSSGGPSPSGTSNPSGELEMGLIGLNVPVGKSAFGESFAGLNLDLNTTTNPGRSALEINAWDGITTTSDAGGLTSVTTQSTYAKIETTATMDDANAYTISLSSNPSSPTTTVFRTVMVETLADGSLQATTVAFSKTRVMNWSQSGSVWTFTDGNGLKKVEKTILSSSSWTSSERLKVYELDPDNTSSYLLVSDVITDYEKRGGAWEKISERIDPDGVNLVSTWTYYAPGDLTGPSSYYGVARLKDYDRYDGYYERHNYYEDTGVIYHLVQMPYGATTVTRTTSWDASTNTLSRVEQFAGSIEIARTDTIYGTNQQTTRQYTSASSYLTTVTEFYAPGTSGLGGRLKKITHPDNTVSLYSYAVDGNGDFNTTVDTGALSGASVVEGTRQVTRVNPDSISQEVAVTAISAGAGNGITLQHWIATAADTYGRPTTTTWFPTSATPWSTTQTFACCGLASETDQYGLLSQYQYDDLGRRIRTNRIGVTEATKHQGLTVSSYRYAETVSSGIFGSSFSNEISRSVGSVSGTVAESWGPSPQTGALVKLSTQTTTYSNPLGTPVSLGTAIGSLIVNEVIQVANDGSLVPTQSQLRYSDGNLYRSWGDLSPATESAYDADSTGPFTISRYLDGIASDGSGGTAREDSYDYRDHAGRAVRSYQAGRKDSYFYYNSLGQLERSVDADGVNTRYAYNSKGERTISALKLNGTTGSITWGTDQITKTETFPALRSSVPVMRTETRVWKPGDTSSTGGTVVATRDRSPDGLKSWTDQLGVSSAATSVVTLSGSGNWTEKSTSPDGSYVVATTQSGLFDNTSAYASNNSLIQSTSIRTAANARGYDSLNRPTHRKDSRTGVTVTAYVSAISDQVASITDPGSRVTAFSYDHRSRQVQIDAPNTLDSTGTTLNNISTTSYFPDGSVQETTGDQTYRTTYTYDYAARRKTLTTYGGTTATTTWNYFTDSGLLSSKKDHANKGAAYTYTSAGRLYTRTWERGVSTTYGYTYGRMTSVDYSGSTPDVALTYDALGRMTLEVQTNRSRIDYAYDATTLAPDTETIGYDLDGNGTTDFTRVLDRSQDSLRRDSGWQLKNGGTVENEVAYTYDNANRLSTVASPAGTFTYAYQSNSYSLLASTTKSGSPVLQTTNTWESTRDVLDVKENKSGSTVISSYDYGVNSYGQRTGVAQAGTAFTSSRSNDWGYNSKGEVVKADSSISGFDRAFLFDGIGNRKKSANSLTLPSSDNYTTNALNQYSAVGSISPTYDDDGNATAYPVPAYPSANSTLAWDGENRLITATVNSVATAVLYDAHSRRIAKTTGSTTTLYVYDGWNCIAEYTGTTLSKTRTWGQDLSGSLQGAGGVGGLLSEKQGSTYYYPTYDGNGNISEYLTASGSITAHFEYDPFGGTTVDTDTGALFTYRFSTKPLDFETGLYYYSYRYYDPGTGRWASRDPIEERGGLNLYSMLRNSPLKRIDRLGLVGILEEITDASIDAIAEAGQKLLDKADLDAAADIVESIDIEEAEVFELGEASMLGPIVIVFALTTSTTGDSAESDFEYETKWGPKLDFRPESQPKEDDEGKCPCEYTTVPRIGGHTKHDAYAAKFGPGEWLVTTPSGKNARYDSGIPGVGMIEAKTGYGFMWNPYWRRTQEVAENQADQFSKQSEVAKECGFLYSIFVDNLAGAKALQAWHPGAPISYVP